MYHDGWKAVTDHVNQLTAAERESLDGSHDFATDRWSLYDLRSDPTETVDLAASEPDRLSDLVGRWHAEAERNGVLPLDDGTIGRFAHMRVRWTPPRSTFRYRSGDKVHEVTGPNLAAGFRVVASLREPLRSGGNAPAVLCEQGDWLSGWALYVAGGDLCWCIATSQGTHVVRGPIPADATHLTASGVPGEHQVAVSLHADEQEVANQVVPVDLPLAWSPDGAFLTVGWARPFPVCEEYAPPASSRDVLDQLVVDVGPPAPFDLEAEVARLLRHQ
jgi:arylsulfatase